MLRSRIFDLFFISRALWHIVKDYGFREFTLDNMLGKLSGDKGMRYQKILFLHA